MEPIRTDIEIDDELTEADLDDLDDSISSKTSYEVWALGVNKFDSVTNFEVLLGEFDDPEEARTFAWTVDLDLVRSKTAKAFPSDLKQLNIDVETVVDNGDYTENIGTILRVELVV